MKKILFAITLTITLGLTATAQYSDGFFNDWDNGLDRTGIGNEIGFVLPTNHGYGVDTPSAPIGSGLLVLTALGAGYAVTRRRKNQV